MDYTTLRVVDSIPTGEETFDLEIDTIRSRLYCTNSRSNTVTVVDCNSLEVVKTIEVGNRPRSLAWSPTHSRMFVANWARMLVVTTPSSTSP